MRLEKALKDEFHVIQCGSEHAEECLEMRNEILADLARENQQNLYLVDETDEEFRHFFADDRSIVLGIKCRGELTCCLISSYREAPLKKFETLIPAEERTNPRALCYLELVQVKKEFRGHGFQRLLLVEIEKMLAARGARYLAAIVSPDNKPSLTNFLAAGFRDVGHFIHEATGYPRVKVVKKLDV